MTTDRPEPEPGPMLARLLSRLGITAAELDELLAALDDCDEEERAQARAAVKDAIARVRGSSRPHTDVRDI